MLKSFLGKTLVIGSAWGLLAASVYAVDPPQILSRGPEESVGGSGRLTAIATDSQNQPHIMADGGPSLHMYDRIGGTPWRTTSLSMASYGFRQYYNPHLEIDSADRAWSSGIMVAGLGLFVRENVAVNPTGPYFSNQRVQGAWDTGNLSIDPEYPTECVLMSAYGYWKKVAYSASSGNRVVDAGMGRMYAGQDGEKKGFWVSKAGAVQHPGGRKQNVWHLAIGGYNSAYPDEYQNSMRHAKGLSRVVWATYGAYSTMQNDGTYVDCVSDSKAAETAYMICDFTAGGIVGSSAGVSMNIWNGNSMVFNANGGLLKIDGNGTSGLRRFSPQLAPAKDGGCYAVWHRGGRVKVRWISPTGALGDEWDVAAGTYANICVDKQGNLHISYVNGGVKYQKWTMSGSVTASSLPGDYDGDGIDDLAVFNPANSRWYIQHIANTDRIVDGRVFGPVGGAPLSGDFDGDGKADLVVFDPVLNVWHIQNALTAAALPNSPTQFSANLQGAIPVVGDFNGDTRDDLGMYVPANGTWFAKDLISGSVLVNGQQLGTATMTPVPADYNGDGTADLAVFDGASAKWYILDGTNLGSKLAWNFEFGPKGSKPIPADFNGDGSADLAVYDATRNVLIYRSLVGTSPAFVRQWGFPGGTPVRGDFNGDTNVDLAVFNSANGNWYILKSEDDPQSTYYPRWGWNGALPVPGDYDGDQTNDLALFDTTSGNWYIRSLSGQTLAWNSNWGFAGCKPVPGDYDGDQVNDLAVYNPPTGRWYVRTLGGTVLAAGGTQWGWNGAVPVPGDYNGDGLSDEALFDPATGKWYIRTLSGTQLAWARQWGWNQVVPVSGDYNNDGTNDLAVFYPNSGLWYIQTMSGTVLASGTQWGWNGAGLVPGDFNGGGSDLTAFNRGNGLWYIRTLGGTVLANGNAWGWSGVTPVSGDYDGDGLTDQMFFDQTVGDWYLKSLTAPATILEFGRNWGGAGFMPIGAAN
jgi:hypothetical protein